MAHRLLRKEAFAVKLFVLGIAFRMQQTKKKKKTQFPMVNKGGM